MLGGFTCAFAEIPLLVAIAKLDCLVFSSRCAGRNGGASHVSVSEKNIRLYRWIAARIEYLSANYFYNFHWLSLGWFVVKSQFRTG